MTWGKNNDMDSWVKKKIQKSQALNVNFYEYLSQPTLTYAFFHRGTVMYVKNLNKVEYNSFNKSTVSQFN